MPKNPLFSSLLEELVRGNDQTLENLRRLRDQRLAHIDSSPSGDMSLEKGNLDRLVEDTEKAFNDLCRMHDRSTTFFDLQVGDTERHTRQVIETLQNAEDARRLRGNARVQIANLLVEAERSPEVNASDQAILQKVMEMILGNAESSWILLRDELPGLSLETSSAEAARMIHEISALVDSVLGV